MVEDAGFHLAFHAICRLCDITGHFVDVASRGIRQAVCAEFQHISVILSFMGLMTLSSGSFL